MIQKNLKIVWENFQNDILFRNSIYLMLTTAVMGGLGFIFWLISTRIFTPEEIGLGSTMVSAMSLISLVSLFGLNSTLIRFLPTSKNRNGKINTAFTIVTITSILFSIIYVYFIPNLSPKLIELTNNKIYVLGFIAITVLSSINSLTDSVFIALRSAQFSLITNGFIVGLSKLVLPVLFSSLGAYGVFGSSGLAIGFGGISSVLILIYKFNYVPRFSLEKEVFKKIFEYSSVNYVGSILSLFPSLLIPIIIVNRLGAAESGYYFLCFMIINMLYAVSSSISQSLFAEGSYGEIRLSTLIKKSVKLLLFLLIPASIVLTFLGPYILSFFGEEYRIGGSKVIILLSIFSPIIAMYNIGNTLLKIRRQMYSIVIINIIYASTICGLTFLWVNKGLEWVAISWIIGNFIAGILSFLMIYSYRHLPTPGEVE